MQLSELDWAYVQERAAYFTGRGRVFARLDQFFDGPPGVFLLLGEPGTGKTAVAAQLALATADRLTPAAAGPAPRRARQVTAAYFCRAGRVDLLDAAQRLSDQLAEAVPGFAHARQATLAPEIHVGDVQVHTGDIAAGGSATGVRIDLSRLQAQAETAFVQAVTLPLRQVREAGESTQVVLLVDALDESLASQTAKELPRLLGDVEDAHLVVTARPDRRATDWLRDRAARVDLLADAPPGRDDVLEYLQRRLTPEGAPAAMAVLAQRIAEQASGNFCTRSMSLRRSVAPTCRLHLTMRLPAGCRCPRVACRGSIAASFAASCGAMTAPGQHGLGPFSPRLPSPRTSKRR
jgi:hypothetical protein